MLLKSSLAVYALLGLCLLATGLLYLSIEEFMPYHAEAVQTQWSDVPPDYQGLILGFLKGLGAGAFVSGSAVLYMAVESLRRSLAPFRLLLPFISIAYPALLSQATYTVKFNTPGNPPLILTLALLFAGLAATGLLGLATRQQAPGRD